MSCKVNGEKYYDIIEFHLNCDITKSQIWEYVKQGVLPEPVYPQEHYMPYWKAETMINFRGKYLK